MLYLDRAYFSLSERIFIYLVWRKLIRNLTLNLTDLLNVDEKLLNVDNKFRICIFIYYIHWVVFHIIEFNELDEKKKRDSDRKKWALFKNEFFFL